MRLDLEEIVDFDGSNTCFKGKKGEREHFQRVFGGSASPLEEIVT